MRRPADRIGSLVGGQCEWLDFWKQILRGKNEAFSKAFLVFFSPFLNYTHFLNGTVCSWYFFRFRKAGNNLCPLFFRLSVNTEISLASILYSAGNDPPSDIFLFCILSLISSFSERGGIIEVR